MILEENTFGRVFSWIKIKKLHHHRCFSGNFPECFKKRYSTEYLLEAVFLILKSPCSYFFPFWILQCFLNTFHFLKLLAINGEKPCGLVGTLGKTMGTREALAFTFTESFFLFLTESSFWNNFKWLLLTLHLIIKF